jgi:rSAM/selenodomain-associated transferase 2
MTLSIVMPVLNEADRIEAALKVLAPLRERGCEVIVVDGGSTDDTPALATAGADRVLTAPRGRASQMNAGAHAAGGDVLLFLHADTVLLDNADRLVRDGLARTGRLWGRFDVQFNGGALPLIAATMNLRSRLTGIATGDQAMFITREAFDKVGGFPDIALMEDIALSTRLKRLSRPLCLAARVTTSPCRWQTQGVVRTVLLMWRLRLAYFFGARHEALAGAYGYAPKH